MWINYHYSTWYAVDAAHLNRVYRDSGTALPALPAGDANQSEDEFVPSLSVCLPRGEPVDGTDNRFHSTL